MMKHIHTRLKLVVVLVSCVLIGVTVYTLYSLFAHNGKFATSLHVVPSDATITIGGERVHGSTAYLTPGTHTVSAYKDGFIPKSIQITVDKYLPNPMIVMGLQPQSDVAKKWASEHQDSYHALEGFAGKQFDRANAAILTRYPILRHLPFKNYLYSIGYSFDDTQQLSLIITAEPGYIHNALNEIRNFGYDPVDFTIIVKDRPEVFSE